MLKLGIDSQPDLQPSGLADVQERMFLKLGSPRTPRWREVDSNPRSPIRRTMLSRLPQRRRLGSLLTAARRAHSEDGRRPRRARRGDRRSRPPASPRPPPAAHAGQLWRYRDLGTGPLTRWIREPLKGFPHRLIFSDW